MKEPQNRQIYNNILETIGKTPLVRLNTLTKEMGIEAEVLLKLEYFNPTGSHKDRLAFNLISTAEAEGKLKPGGTIIEATSGNTGLGLCLVAAIKGYRAIMVAQPKTSQEKIDLMKGLGAEVVLARSMSSTDPEGVLSIAKRLSETIPNSFYTQQFSNPANPETHMKATGLEIYEQTDGKLDYFFMAVGTGGTITGTGRVLKEKDPNIKVIGCDPVGSIIGSKGSAYKPFKVEGIGRDVVPPNCDLNVIDDWVKFTDKQAFDTARKVMKVEGIMCGGSAGGVLWSTLHYLKEKKLGKDKTVVVFIPDTSRNYLTRFMNNEWMLGNNFMDEEEYRELTMDSQFLPETRHGDDITLKEVESNTLATFTPETTIHEVWNRLKKDGFVMVKDNDSSEYKGLLVDKDVISVISRKKLRLIDPISKVMSQHFFVLSKDLKLSTAQKMMENCNYILFENEEKEINVVKSTDLMNNLELALSEELN
jgi:cystathionine beta-synthase